MKKVEIVFPPSGELQVEAVGFRGADCEKATQFLEQALGKLVNRWHKPEYHAPAKTKTQQRIGP
jgi:hypothetical protein